MKRLFAFLILVLFFACASHHSDWDSGALKGEQLEAQRQEELDETLRWQVPEPRAITR